jgi:2-polyprenyl-6-methoxyphenol hydroxylase-like FAD-dependent oxidoreductase
MAPMAGSARADLGLGVNSALQDVDTLSSSLAQHDGDAAAALHAYERVRLPENTALMRLMQVRRHAVPSRVS